MSDTPIGDSSYVQVLPPSPSRKEVTEGGYTAAFYPGFVRGVVVERAGQSTTLYTQPSGEPFVLPAGALLPWASSEFTFSGGPNARNFSLVINDPLYEIASIEIRLKPKGTLVGVGPQEDLTGENETVTIQEATVTCPPVCDPG
jgi:hypothetical protein